MKRACTIGSATYDLFLLYEGADTLHLHQRQQDSSYLLLEQGTKIDVPHIVKAPGGGGLNVATGLQRNNIAVEAFFRTGNDEAGTILRTYMEQEGISTQHATVDDEHATALSIIIPSQDQDHVALCHRGANRFQQSSDFPHKLLQELDLLFIGPLGGASENLLPELGPLAQAAHVPLAATLSAQQLTNRRTPVKDLLNNIDIIFMNRHESALILQGLMGAPAAPCAPQRRSQEPTLISPYVTCEGITYTLQDVIETITACGPRLVVVTNGSEGSYVGHEGLLYFYPSTPTANAFSLGAGDAFTSGFLGAYMHGHDIPQALLYGIANASSVLSYPDAQQGLLTYEVLTQYVQSLSLQRLYTTHQRT